MAFTQRQIEAHLEKLRDVASQPGATHADQVAVEMCEIRVAKLKRLGKVKPTTAFGKEFNAVFRSTGLVAKRELHADWQASELPLSVWLKNRRAYAEYLLHAREKLRKLLGRKNFQIRHDGVVLTKVGATWTQLGPVERLVPRESTS